MPISLQTWRSWDSKSYHSAPAGGEELALAHRRNAEPEERAAARRRWRQGSAGSEVAPVGLEARVLLVGLRLLLRVVRAGPAPAGPAGTGAAAITITSRTHPEPLGLERIIRASRGRWATARGGCRSVRRGPRPTPAP